LWNDFTENCPKRAIILSTRRLIILSNKNLIKKGRIAHFFNQLVYFIHIYDWLNIYMQKKILLNQNLAWTKLWVFRGQNYEPARTKLWSAQNMLWLSSRSSYGIQNLYSTFQIVYWSRGVDKFEKIKDKINFWSIINLSTSNIIKYQPLSTVVFFIRQCLQDHLTWKIPLFSIRLTKWNGTSKSVKKISRHIHLENCRKNIDRFKLKILK